MDEHQALGAALEREHREIDEGLERFASGLAGGEWRRDAVDGAAAALRRHIYLEEEFLFPTLRAAGFIAPVMVMLREHGEIWEALDAVQGDVANGSAGDAIPAAYDRLAFLLESHNDKEEKILYPVVDRTITGEEHDRLTAFIESGTLPEGWVCERLR